VTLILELPDKKEAALKAKAESQGVSPEEYAKKVLYRDLDEAANAAETAPRRHISEVIRERINKLPPEVWKDFPTDGASEHDHYIYGLPKRNA
jgi:hypothetical protein